MDSKHSSLRETVKSKYQVGQVWTYTTRSSEPDAKLTIVKVEGQDSIGNIIHVYVSNVKIKTSLDPDKYSETISHMPFSEAAIDSSVTKQIGTVTKLPDFKAGYDEWRRSFDAGHAGVFTITVGKAVEYMETAVLNGHKTKD
ncbi:hypothetical protein IC235_04920 [Hymenobacter sp. BT664]|uniref:Uncharacterized protein n=1 Tax=Hymenobacter montanus TaxID=2771359 RepID=A0A927GI97_9BACT|nr:hypothetical protein [Hymenobacter montanus]MBD2767228.1 hypothetical protein [Hymenobacter montanus]